MARVQRITFSKEYVLEVATTELRNKHNIPEDFVTKFKDYGDDYLSFTEQVTESVDPSQEEGLGL